MPDPVFRAELIAPPPGLFDVHVNIGMSDSPALTYGRMPGEEYLGLMEACGISRACAFPPLMERPRAANEQLATWAAGTDGRVLPFARLGGQRGPQPIREAWQARRRVRSYLESRPSDVANLERYAGIKLSPHLSGMPTAEELEQIDALRLPVLIHAGVHVPPQWIERALVGRLRGPIILAHLGGFPCDAGLIEDAVAIARRHANVYLDTCGAWIAGFITYAAAQVPDKIMFGSDAPMLHPLVAWYHVASAITDDDLLERIAFRTAESVFGTERPAPASPSAAAGRSEAP